LEEGCLGAELERRQEGRAAAQREVDGRRAQLATAEAERREAERHLTLFGSAAKAPLCEMCGQEISRRYAAERSQHLTRALAAAQERLLAAQAALSEGEGRLAQAQQAEAEVQARLMQVRRERSAWEEKLRQAADRLDAATARIAELCAGASEAELLQAAAQEAEQRRRRDDLRRRWKEAHAAGKAAAQRRDAARQRIEQLRKERDQGDHLAGQIAEIARQLAALPEEARRPAAEVEALIQGLSRRQKELSVEQGRRAQALADLRRKVEERQRREAEQDQAARDLALYKRVAELLGPGPGGLQRHLVREAEEGIVRYANDILHDLTQGRLRLRLQREDSPGAQKALDLLVYNQETSDRPMPIAMCSGSQRFRIAISLALATGRYLSQNARRVESVIIDEGFGCLDQEGRADTVEVLRALKAHLKRIILVSHQEELTQSFTHGYRIELRERASVPVPL
jgi:DNA repair exonuclease SbcCD ATPase subunit